MRSTQIRAEYLAHESLSDVLTRWECCSDIYQGGYLQIPAGD